MPLPPTAVGPSVASPASAAGPPKYVVDKPARQSLTVGALLESVGEQWRLFIYLVRHIFGMFDEAPKAACQLTSSDPGGEVSSQMLDVCQFLANDSEARQAKLETKATGLLSLIAVVIPLAASAAVFIRQNEMSPFIAGVTLALNLLAMLCFVVGLFAALRAVAVRSGSTLFLNAVIDPSNDEVRSYSSDFFGRGLLHDAANRQAICDHIADFVRGAQTFLVLGVLLAATAAVPVLFSIRHEAPTIHGKVSIDAESLQALERSVTITAAESKERMNRFELELETLKSTQSDSQVKAEIERLSKELAELRRGQGKQPAPRRSSD